MPLVIPLFIRQLLVLEKDPIFQARLKERFSQLGVIFWKLASTLAEMKLIESVGTVNTSSNK